MKKSLPQNHLIADIPELTLIIEMYKKLYLTTPTFPQVKEIQRMRDDRKQLNPKLIKNA